jgi:predicted Fe-Mo cluster-binding NifX family protein
MGWITSGNILTQEDKIMKICIPTETAAGLEARVFEHFGSAPYFIVYDTDTKTFEVLNNGNQQHEHGMCQPLGVLGDSDFNTVVCKGMGARAVQKLNQAGIRVYKAVTETVRETVGKYNQGSLAEITVVDACNHHDCH